MKFLVALLFSALFCGKWADGLNANWWKNTEIYDIIVSAYKDNNGDGVGDLEGLLTKMDYIKELGVRAMKLSPIFASREEATTNYPIEDFQNVHLGFGTLEDFDVLVRLANTTGIQVLLDLIINHCSIEHEWFKKSQKRIEPYTDYFIWSSDGKNPTKFPTSLSNVWEYDETREQFYYHRFDKTTADLNLKNEAVKSEIKNLLKFWLDRGVSGFNLLSAEVYMEDDQVKNYEYPPLSMLEDKPESYEFIHELREYIDIYNQQKGGNERILILEERQIEKYPNLHGSANYPIAHIVSKQFFGRDNTYYAYFTPSYVKEAITNIMKELKNGPTMYILEDLSMIRTINRFQDRQYLDVWLTTLFMLPNVVHIYYGQEIGMSTWKFAHGTLRVITAMQWDQSLNAGFTSNEVSPYAPNVDYWKVNVENLKNAQYSTLKSVQDLLRLRKTKAIQLGDLTTYEISELVFAFSRSYGDQEKLITIMNLSNALHTVDLNTDVQEFIPPEVRIVSSSPNSIYHTGDVFDTTTALSMSPVSAIVISIKK